MAVGGDDGSGNMLWSVAATIFDDYRVAESLSQTAIEEMQFLDFVRGAQERGELPGFESYQRPESDPPDLLVRARGRDFGVELTSITTTDVSRQRLAEVRAIGRNLSEKIKRDSTNFAHLVGTQVILTEMASDQQRPPRAHGRQMTEVVDRLAAALGPGIGVVDTTPQGDPANPPVSIPAEIAMRGRARLDDNTYGLEVHRTWPEAEPKVIANCQVELNTQDVASAFVELVQRKDRTGTDFLLVTTGLPANDGYACPADSFLFEMLKRQFTEGTAKLPPIRHLRQIVLNHWGHPPWTVVFFAGNEGLLQRPQG